METGNALDLSGLVRIVLKLSGLALAVYGAVMLSGFMALSLSGPGGFQDLVFMSQPVILLAAGLFLWLFPAPVANTVIRPLPPGVEPPSWADRLMEVGAVLIGLWWLISAISDLVYHLLMNRAQDEMLGHAGGYDDFWPMMIATFFEFGLALVLILGARGIVGLIIKLRQGGLASDGMRE